MRAIRDEPRLDVVEAVLLGRRRWWSYCEEVGCCPPEGRPLEQRSTALTTLAAAYALTGSAVLPDRAALASSVGVEPDADTPEQRRCLLAAGERASRLTVADRRGSLLALVDTLAERLTDPRRSVADTEAVQLATLARDVAARDDVLLQAVSPARREQVLRVLRAAARRTPSPYDAPLCTMLAWFAYADGDGTLANIALERALRSEPDFPLALLVRASLDRQLPPSSLMEVMGGAAREIAERDAAG